MFHQQIKLQEKHHNYPTLWNSLCGRWRIIRCKDYIQFIVQQFKLPTWRSDSYHVEWNSISLIHSDKDAFKCIQTQYKLVHSKLMYFYDSTRNCQR